MNANILDEQEITEETEYPFLASVFSVCSCSILFFLSSIQRSRIAAFFVFPLFGRTPAAGKS
jgi:hypothetical protein